MLACRLRQYRLARGWSMDELVAAMGGVVTKQSLSKYERDISVPSPTVLRALSKALGVSVARLMKDEAVEVEIRAYRRKARLGRKEMARIESYTAVSLQDRIRLDDTLGLSGGKGGGLPVIPIETVGDAEGAADQVRRDWGLGEDPIACVLDTLEENHIHVVEVEASEAFDGISAVAMGPGKRARAAAVVVRKGLPGERQRLGLTHELGHLVLDAGDQVDGEKAAFRFGAAMLAPASAVRREVGERRRRVDLQELLLLKLRYGMSVQALLYRMRDLEIISKGQHKTACVDINRLGWRRGEPMVLPPEKPTWLRRNVLRAVSEGLVSTAEGERMLGEAIDKKPTLSLIQRRALMKMSVEERRRHLRKQAEKIAEEYRPDPDWQAISGENFVEY